MSALPAEVKVGSFSLFGTSFTKRVDFLFPLLGQYFMEMVAL